MQSDDIKVYDAFEQLFDASGRAAIKLLTKNEVNLELDKILETFIKLIFYGLPGADESIIESGDNEINLLRSNDKSWNIFSSNPAASAMAACIIHTINSNALAGQFQARQLVSLAIPNYVAFLSHALLEFAEDYSQFTNRKSKQNSDFEGVVNKLKNLLTSNSVKKTAAGIENLIDALMFIRERRVEEVPLTFEIDLGPFGMWESIERIGGATDDATQEIKTQIKKIRKSIDGIDLIGKIPTKKIAREVETNAKHFGRGVAILELSNSDDSEKIHINVRRLWKTHEKAPLSNLYGFDWNPPNPEQNNANTQLHLVLLPSGVISIQIGNDPLLEYFAGGWRYVDSYHKSIILSRRAAKFNEKLLLTSDNISLPIYRCSRLAYQLSYHNHGSTVDLNFGVPVFSPQGKLKDTILKGGIFDPDEISWREIKSRIGDTNDDDNDTEVGIGEDGTKIGRWVYQLCISDGITSLYVDDNSNLFLGDFGQIIQFKEEINVKWKEFFRTIPGNEESDVDIGGARHTAAFQCAYNDAPYESKGKMVFCISQDGFIDVYMKDDWLKLR